MKEKEKIGILQFGCAKNLVDLELMLGLLVKNGYKYSLNPYEDDIKTVIINTCSFILDAEKESDSSNDWTRKKDNSNRLFGTKTSGRTKKTASWD